jgi:hypothetical protein
MYKAWILLVVLLLLLLIPLAILRSVVPHNTSYFGGVTVPIYERHDR